METAAVRNALTSNVNPVFNPVEAAFNNPSLSIRVIPKDINFATVDKPSPKAPNISKAKFNSGSDA